MLPPPAGGRAGPLRCDREGRSQVGKGLARAGGALGAAQKRLRVGSREGICGTGRRERRRWGSPECTVG